MTAEYRKSWGMKAERDAFWEAYQEGGKRTKYNFAFVNFDADTFYPKYDICPTQFQYGFGNTNAFSSFAGFDLCERLRECGVVLDTGECTDMSSAFLGTYMVAIPALDLRSAIYTANIFRNAANIRRIEKLIVGENTTFSGVFQLNNALEEIRFEGIISNDINLQWSTKLSRDSIDSLFWICNESQGYSFNVTLSLAAVNKAFETSVGANDGSTSEDWEMAVNYSHQNIILV
jgi:hypothetical protein